MNNIASKVINLSKKYTFSHQNKERYTALRDVVTYAAKRLRRKLVSPVTFHTSPISMGVKGFTLVELAVVLVILGTIYMSVLKVQSMVKNAKIQQVINQYREIRTAVLVYKDKYGYLPGDDPKARTHLGPAAMGAAKPDGDKGGDGNSYISTAYISYPVDEQYTVFNHLSLAGLLSGPNAGGGVVKDIFGKTVYIVAYKISPSTTAKNNYIRFALLPPDVAQALDAALDDGLSNSGSVLCGDMPDPYDSLLLATSYRSTTGNLPKYTLIKIE